ncbi:serine/threonine protein kinase [Plantactinospora sp. WMMB782]|uniref:serine/threonine protein kinase n=1 Tax=Plantactinospora sp. WMMB782 TaxID=3404121 RepID=UPI003B962603
MNTEARYRELVPLADGPTASVLAAVDARTGEAYALRVLPGVPDRRTRTRLENELARLAPLADRAPILVADRLEEFEPGRWALRMALCSQSLTDLLDSFGPLSVPDTVALGTALTRALVAAHAAGVTHGALTPGNVLFRPDGAPLLSDFGPTLRQAFPADPANGVGFLAPETIRDATVDERSDLYGLGALLHLALTGLAPHHGPPGEQPADRMLRVLGVPVPALERADLPAGFADLVAELLSGDPGDRPPTATAVLRRLDRLDGHRPADAAEVDGTAARHAGTAPEHADPAAQQADAATQQVDPAAQRTDTATQQADAATQQVDSATQRTDSAPGHSGGAAPRHSGGAAPEHSGGAAPEHSGGAVPGHSGGVVPAAPVPLGAPVVEFGPRARPRWITRPAVLVAACVVALLAVGAGLALTGRDGVIDAAPMTASPATATPVPTPRATSIELTEVVDRGEVVELTWRGDGSLDYAVVVAEEGAAARTLLVQRRTSHRVRVDPVRRYCFEIQGTNGPQIFFSAPTPIRGAVCGR